MLYRHPLITEPMMAVTALGSLTLAIMTVLVIYTAGEKELAVNTLTGLLLANSVVYISKAVVARPRPEYILPEVARYTSTSGFPSGHTATAFLLAGALSGQINRKTAYILAVSVAASRLYLGAHFASDVIAGAAIGILAWHTVNHWNLSETISSTLS